MLVARLRAAIGARVRNWARRRQGMDSVPLTLEKRRVYILPTAFGVLFAFFVLVMLLAAMNYNNSLGLALTFLRHAPLPSQPQRPGDFGRAGRRDLRGPAARAHDRV
jgi:hypothetical protein